MQQHVACFHLLGCQEVRQRENYVPFDGALQMASAVALIRAFVQEKVAACIGHAEQELPVLCLQTRCCTCRNSICRISARCS